MNKTLRIHTVWVIPRDITRPLVKFLLFYSIFAELLISMFGMPSAMRYLNDAIVAVLFVLCLGQIIPTFQKAKCTPALVMMSAYIISLLIGLLLNGGKVLLILWASRNVFRFFAYFIICVHYLRKDDVLRLLDALYKLRWLNFILCLYQYFVMGKEQDYLGGMFGTMKGCNAGTNVYLCILIVLAVCRYLDGREKIGSALLTVITSVIIAALSELKVLYFEIVAIVGIALFLGHKKGKLWPIVLSIVVSIVAGLLLLKVVFPKHYEIVVNWTDLLDYGSTSESAYKLSRFNAFSNINELFFDGNTAKNLFGLGFGNCEYSVYSFLTSDFFRSYGFYNYRWFAHQMMFLESGYIGFFLYLGILVSIILCAYRAMKQDKQMQYLGRFVVIFGVLTILCLWYNAGIRTESGYLAYFALAAMAICQKDRFAQSKPLMERESVQ